MLNFQHAVRHAHIYHRHTALLRSRNAGLNVYLISRTEAKLQAAAAEVGKAYGVETKYYVADLIQAGAAAHDGSCWYGLRANIADMDVGVLVNNAGMSYEHAEYLHNVDMATVSDIIAINVTALTKMVQTVLPGMVERKRGCIVNISSGVSTALSSCPLLDVYAASKAYVDVFSAALAAEYAPFGIAVQVRTARALARTCFGTAAVQIAEPSGSPPRLRH